MENGCRLEAKHSFFSSLFFSNQALKPSPEYLFSWVCFVVLFFFFFWGGGRDKREKEKKVSFSVLFS